MIRRMLWYVGIAACSVVADFAFGRVSAWIVCGIGCVVMLVLAREKRTR